MSSVNADLIELTKIIKSIESTLTVILNNYDDESDNISELMGKANGLGNFSYGVNFLNYLTMVL